MHRLRACRCAVAFISLVLLCPLLLAAMPAAAAAPAKQAGHGQNMRLVAASDLQGRTAYQAVIRRQGERTIAYVGHTGGEAFNPLTRRMEYNGTSIVDATDPRNPQYLAHIPGERGEVDRGGARMTRVCSGQNFPAADGSRPDANRADAGRFYLLRSLGDSSHEIWNVSRPESPEFVTTVTRRLRTAYRTWWECDTGIAYLISGDALWRAGRMLQIFDLSNPAQPVFIRGFGLPGQEPGGNGPVPPPMLSVQSVGPEGNRVYLGYGVQQGGVLQILDREKLLRGPKEHSPESLLYPQIARLDLPGNATANVVQPLIGVEIEEFATQAEGRSRHFVAIVGRPLRKGCQESRQMMWIIDISDELRPFGVSTWTVPQQAGRFCARGGRFGAYSINDSSTPVYHKRILFVAHMNAGVRAVDVRNPLAPREIGYFVPDTSDKTVILYSSADKDKGIPALKTALERPVVQTNDVEVDDRGYIYAVDRAGTGMHILELTGAARRVADLKAARKP